MKGTNFTKHLLLIALLAIGNTLFAQEDLNGWIITLQGEKLNGKIKSWDIGTNPTSIMFKADSEREFAKYFPHDIKSFQIENERNEVYEGGTFDIELSSVDPNTLSDTSLLILERQTAFLQVIYLGPKSLYAYRNLIKDQFYIKQDTTFELLVFKKYTKWQRVANEHRKLVFENKKYQGQLLIYLDNLEQIQKKIRDLDYNESEISQLFDTYYNVNYNLSYQSFIAERNTFIKPGLVLGMGIINMDYVFALGNDNPDFKTVNQMIPLLGVTIEIPTGTKRWSFYFEYVFKGGYNKSLTTEPDFSENLTYKRVYNINYSSNKITALIRHRLPLDKLTYFYNFGISHQTLRLDIDENVTTYYHNAILNIKNWPLDSKSKAVLISAGAGIRRKALSVELRLEPAIDRDQKFMGSLLLNYYFGKEIK